MVESTGVLLASGSRVALRYARESVRGTTPAGVTAAITGISATAGTPGSTGIFNRATGSFITSGFIKGQRVTVAGFSSSASNGTWIVEAVAALSLTVRDPSSLIVTETAGGGKSVRINLNTLRGTSRAVNLEKNILESQEIDPDGQETDSRHGFNRVVGAPGFQLNRRDFDDFIQYAMGREWDQGSTIISTGVNLGLNSSRQYTRASGSWITLGFRPGDIVTVAGFSNSDNNGQKRVTAVTSSLLTVYDPDSAMDVEASGASKTVTLTGKRIDIGTEMQTFLLEAQFLDIAQYRAFNGCAIDQFALTIEPESMINGTFNILGMIARAIAGSSVGGTALNATSNAPYAAFEGQLFEGGELIGVATSMNFSLARNRSLNPVIGSKFSPDVFDGTARCTGTFGAYFDDATLLNKFINETESSLWLRMDDPNFIGTHFMNIVFPRVKYNGGTIDPPQQGPVTMEMPFRALKATGLAAASGGTRNTLMTIQVSNDIDN